MSHFTGTSPGRFKYHYFTSCSFWSPSQQGIPCISRRLYGNFFKISVNSYKICCCPVVKSWPTLCNLINCSTLGFLVFHYFPEFAQTHVHWVSDAIQPSHSLSPPSPPALNLSQHQGLFQWVSSSHQVAKVLKLQLQHQYFQWIFRTDSL